ncbi:hypothetical protein H0H93_010494, partial [Arthromyces matolae]
DQQDVERRDLDSETLLEARTQKSEKRKPKKKTGLPEHFQKLPQEMKEEVGKQLADSDGPGKHTGGILANSLNAASPSQRKRTNGKLEHQQRQNEVNKAIHNPNDNLDSWSLVDTMNTNRESRRGLEEYVLFPWLQSDQSTYGTLQLR